jgi:predicted signal transduction protein with EAL and GGDEF domain
VVKVDMVHENSKNLKLEVPPDDTMLTLQDAITKRVQWRRTSIDVNPSAATSALATTSQLNTAPALIFPDTQPD